MIPIRLRLRNFMSYGESVQPLDFTRIHLACLCGDNGHGKSALLDAITWAIWGRTRVSERRDTTDDELIHLGRTEMEVEFEFELDGNRYLVLRKRGIKTSGKRRASVGSLEFQVADGDGYRALSGDSQSATQRKIVEVLRLDYDTFVNSAFILQGRADEFTRKTSTERKRILSDLLGLGYYDSLEERARERARRFESERREQTALIEEIDRDLAAEPRHVGELLRLNGVVDGLTGQIERHNADVTRLRGVLQEMELKATQRAETQARIARAEAGLRGIRTQIAQAETRLRERETLVAQGERVRQGVTALAATRAEIADLDARFQRLHDLTRRKAEIEAKVAQARAELEGARRLRASEVARLEGELAKEAGLKRQEGELRPELAKLAPVVAERDALARAIEEAHTQSELLKATNVRIKDEGMGLRERLEVLALPTAACPVCGGALDRAGRERLRAGFAADRQRLLNEYQANAVTIATLDAREAAARQRLEASDAAAKRQQTLDRTLATVERALADLAGLRDDLATAKAESSALAARLEAKDYAPAERAELGDLNSAIAALDYDAARHQASRARRDELARYEALVARLDEAEAALPAERESLESLRQIEEQSRNLVEADQRALGALDVDLRGKPAAERDLAQAKRSLDEAIRRHADAREARGEVQQRINHCQYQRAERDRRESARVVAVREKDLHDELTLAFGKKGIQAMVIESVIPEIELESNSILARMTDGRLNVKFETQRDARSGDGVIETLDIKIADELGVRNLELYSGGEAFRVNFAVRIALAKLLARRAGARVQTLVMDEGFGTQDAFGRQRLIEAINAVSEDFAKIIVITHIEELKDAFPTRIDVVKGADGSRFTVS